MFTIAIASPAFDRWQALLGVIRESFAYMDGVIDPPSSAHKLNVHALRDKAMREMCFVATEVATATPTADPSPQGEPGILGCAFLAEHGDLFYLGKLAVLPAWQGKGVGRALMAAAEAHARQSGKPIIELQTRVELTDNHRAFAALGFAETGRTAHAGYERATSITMRKALT